MQLKIKLLHNCADILASAHIKQNIIVRHLAHSELWIPVLQNGTLQRHIPDPCLFQSVQDLAPFNIQQNVFADRLFLRLRKIIIVNTG